jgi:transcriptional regulator with XRE-family HTH domain
MRRLTFEREQHGWSKAELARRARLHPSTVGAIETGRQLPYPAQLRKLALALGLQAEEAADLMEEVANASAR